MRLPKGPTGRDHRRPFGSATRLELKTVLRWCAILVAGLGLGVLAEASMVQPGASGSSRLPAAKLISLRYGDYLVPGASHRVHGYQLVAKQKHGQILEIEIRPHAHPAGITAESKCGVGGRRNGAVETFVLPSALNPGGSTVTVSVRGDSCAKHKRTRKVTRSFQVSS